MAGYIPERIETPSRGCLGDWEWAKALVEVVDMSKSAITPYREPGSVEAELEDYEADVRLTYTGAPVRCPFCKEVRHESGRMWNANRVKAKWYKRLGRVLEKCRTCHGEWWVSPIID